MLPIEIIGFLIGHITGWGEGVQRNVSRDQLLASGVTSALISFVLVFLLSLGLPAFTEVTALPTIMGGASGLESALMGGVSSAAFGLLGTFFGFYTRHAQEQLQMM